MLNKKNSVTRICIAKDLRKKFQFTAHRSQEIVDLFFNILSAAMLAEKRIEIRGFGSFYISHCKPRKGRNPMLPQDCIEIPARKYVKFKQSKCIELKKEM